MARLEKGIWKAHQSAAQGAGTASFPLFSAGRAAVGFDGRRVDKNLFGRFADKRQRSKERVPNAFIRRAHEAVRNPAYLGVLFRRALFRSKLHYCPLA